MINKLIAATVFGSIVTLGATLGTISMIKGHEAKVAQEQKELEVKLERLDDATERLVNQIGQSIESNVRAKEQRRQQFSDTQQLKASRACERGYRDNWRADFGDLKNAPTAQWKTICSAVDPLPLTVEQLALLAELPGDKNLEQRQDCLLLQVKTESIEKAEEICLRVYPPLT